MQRYRIAFFAMLATTILLAGAACLTLVRSARGEGADFVRCFGPALGKPRLHPKGGETRAILSQDPTEPSLVPVTLTPQRMQSIGVKTGAVEYRQVHDEIRTTGNVEADETRLAEVQVRFCRLDTEGFRGRDFQAGAKGPAAC